MRPSTVLSPLRCNVVTRFRCFADCVGLNVHCKHTKHVQHAFNMRLWSQEPSLVQQVRVTATA